MIDILFAHSYVSAEDSSPLAGPYPPLAAMYAAAHLRDHGYAVALHDTTLEESGASFALSLDRHQPNSVAIFDDVMHDPTGEKIASRREATLAMIRAARRRGLAVVVASAAADQDPGAFLTAGAGFVLFGEAEATLAALARAWIGPPRRGAAGRGSVPPSTLVVDPAEIPGLIYRDARCLDSHSRQGVRRFSSTCSVFPPGTWWTSISIAGIGSSGKGASRSACRPRGAVRIDATGAHARPAGRDTPRARPRRSRPSGPTSRRAST
ncbi:MAG: hypothetical protein U0527_05000 [Candidatus Eisenbacteria bacterium]